MNGAGYAIVGYVIGIGLPLAYALRLWVAHAALNRQRGGAAMEDDAAGQGELS